MEGIATTLTTWNPGRARPTAPPRAVFTKLNRGATLGEPHDHAQQRRILKATLDLLAQDAPLEPITLEESAE
jgi:hypothetical protein